MRRLAFVIAAVLLVVPAATARNQARPGFTSQPETPIGTPTVGSSLLLGNGSPYCAPSCDPASPDGGPDPGRRGTFYQVLRCVTRDGGGYSAIPGGTPDTDRPCSIRAPNVFAQPRGRSNTYVVTPADVGYFLQLEVFLVNYDCGEVIREGPDAGKQECHYDERAHGYSTPTERVTGPVAPPPPPPPPAVPTAAATKALMVSSARLWEASNAAPLSRITLARRILELPDSGRPGWLDVREAVKALLDDPGEGR